MRGIFTKKGEENVKINPTNDIKQRTKNVDEQNMGIVAPKNQKGSYVNIIKYSYISS